MADLNHYGKILDKAADNTIQVDIVMKLLRNTPGKIAAFDCCVKSD